MRLKILEHDDLKFYVREGTSDEKAFREVIEKNSYQRKYFQIESGEEWIDLGGNVGAFALMVLKNNAKVKIYEPDPFSCRMIEKNLKLNNFDADIIQKAVVSSDEKLAFSILNVEVVKVVLQPIAVSYSKISSSSSSPKSICS